MTFRIRDFSSRKTLQRAALAHVALAVKENRLQKLDGTIPCTDCSHPATEYDHRDYRHPLQVEAVCHGCNIARGKAYPIQQWGHQKLVNIAFDCLQSQKRQLEEMADKTERSLSGLLRLIVKQYLDTDTNA